MKLQIKFLKEFRGLAPESSTRFRTYKVNDLLEIDADVYGVPTHSFWYEQLRFEENKSYFDVQTSLTKKTKN